VLRYGVNTPDPAHHGKFVSIEATRQLPADQLPAITSILAAKQFVGGEIKSRMRVRTDDERRVPVPTKRFLSSSYLRLNTHALAGPLVETRQRSVLKL